jgi:hypothetical protein
MNDTEILEQVREMILNLAARSEPVFTRPLAEIIAYISENSGPARSMKRELAQRAWDAEKVIREIVRLIEEYEEYERNDFIECDFLEE